MACNPGLVAFIRGGTSRRSFLRAAGGLTATALMQPAAALAQTVAYSALDRPGRSGADTVFLNGTILTMDARSSRAEALAVSGGRITAVGDRQEIEAHRGPNTRVVDLGGNTVLPGFIDPHMHAAFTFFDDWTDVGPFTLTNFDDVRVRLREAVGATAPGAWVRASQFDPVLTRGTPRIDRALLDAIAPDNPLFLYESNGHVAHVNSAALRAARVGRDTPDPPLGRFGRDANGELTGRLDESSALLPFVSKMPVQTQAESRAAIRSLFDRAASRGCTGLHDCGIGLIAGSEDLAALRDVMATNPPVRLGGALVSTSMKDWRTMGLTPGSGDHRLNLTAIKAWSDGSNQGFSGYQREPYLNSQSRGALNYTVQQLTDAVREAHELGWQVSVHANGDAAIDTTLDAYETVLKAAPRSDHRHRIEHCSILHGDQIDRMRTLGLSPSFLIGHVYYWGRAFRDTILGPERADLLDPCASALKAGLRFTLHSDWNVTDIDPLRMIGNAVTRTMRDGGDVLNPSERVSAQQAIRAMTADAAWQTRRDDYCGSLEVGKYADLARLERDPTSVDPAEIANVGVVETWLEGERRHQA